MAERINVSTRLTEVYRKIEPASGSEYFPFADSRGKEYILFTAADGSIGYYCEESTGFVPHSLNASGTITSLCAMPLPVSGKLKPAAAYFSAVQKDGKKVFYNVDQNAEGQLEASLSAYPGVALGCASGFCGDQGIISFVGDSGKYSDQKQLDYINLLIDGGTCLSQTVGYHADYTVGPAALCTAASGKAWPMHMLIAHPKSAGEEWRPTLRFTLLDNRVGTGQGYIPKDMAPCDVIDMQSVCLEVGKSCFLFLISHKGQRELWIATSDELMPGNFRPLIQQGQYQPERFTVQPVEINGEKGGSLLFEDRRYPGKLYHAFFNPTSWNCCTPLPLENNMKSWHDCANLQGRSMFYYTRTDGSLLRMHYDAKNNTWQENTIADNVQENVRSLAVYEHRLMVTDEKDCPVSGAAVQISAAAPMIVEAAGKYYTIGGGVPVTLNTDVRGTLCVRHETAALADADIEFTLASGQGNQKIVSSPAEFQKKRMQKLSGVQLRDACLPDGQPLLEEKRRKDMKTLDAVATSVRDIAGYHVGDSTFSSGCTAFSLERMEDGSVRRRELSHDEFEAERAAMLSSCENGFFSDIADFFRSVAKGIAKVFKIIAEGVKSVVHFILDGVERVIEFVMDCVQRVVDAIETILGVIIEAFAPLFQWLGELVGLSSILRAQRAVLFLFDEAKNGLNKHLRRGTAYLREGVKKAEGQLEQIMEAFQGISGDITPSSHREDADTFQKSYGQIGSNYILDLVYSPDAVIAWEEESTPEISTSIKDLMDFVEAFSKKVEASEAYKDLRNFLSSLGDNIKTMKVADLLAGMFAFFKFVLDVIGQAAEDVAERGLKCLDELTALLERKISIPFVGLIFKAAFRQELTYKNLTTLLIAFPFQLLERSATGHSPFESDEQVKRFQTECLAVFNGDAEANIRISADTKKKLMAVGGVCQGIGYGATLCADLCGYEGEGESSVSANRFDFVSASASLIGLATSFPLFYADEKGWNPARSFGMWASTAVNTIVGCLGACSDGKGVKIGVSIFSSLIGGAYTFFAIWNWAVKGIDFWLPFANDISLMLQGICRFLLLFQESMIFLVEIAFDFSCSAFGFMQARWEIADNEEWSSDWPGAPLPILEV